MKEWFKYEHGFVNIDERNIYLTNTGNWSEVENIKKRNVRSSVNRKRIRIQFFLIMVALVSLIVIALRLETGASFYAVLGIPVTFIVVYRYLRSELGPRYLIPISRIKKIETIRSITYIHYALEQQKVKVERLENIEEKGLGILQELKNTNVLIK